jgi:hypothetical protein
VERKILPFPGEPEHLLALHFASESTDLRQSNEVQHESNQFGVLSLQKHIDDIDMQISAFVRNSILSFSPDVIGDLLFNGLSPFARRSDLAEGVQLDARKIAQRRFVPSRRRTTHPVSTLHQGL